MSNPSDFRKFGRVPVSLEVNYRTQGSFLVSYSRNLSKGGIFLETTHLLPIGTQLTLRFAIPGASEPIETEAKVMWIRPQALEAGLPPGLGLQFEGLEERMGAIIDELVQNFAGVNLMAIARDNITLDRLERYLRSILTCNVIQYSISDMLVSGFALPIDLVLLDLDSTDQDGLVAIEMAHQTTASPIPVVVLTRNTELKAAALAAGASAVLDNPPPYDYLREQVLEVLGRPFRAQ